MAWTPHEYAVVFEFCKTGLHLVVVHQLWFQQLCETGELHVLCRALAMEDYGMDPT